MPEIQIDITKLFEKYLIPLVISFTVGLVFYLTVFDLEWGWPTVIGCGCFLLIQSGIWMKRNYDRNKSDKMERQAQLAKKAIIQCEIQAQERERREAAKVFLHSCRETAVGLYKYQKHVGEKETERYIAFGDYPEFDYAENIGLYELDVQYRKFRFLYSDSELSREPMAPIHVIFDPIFYELVKNYVETGVIAFPEEHHSIRGNYNSNSKLQNNERQIY
jgi:hypothetical protein